VFHFCSIRGGLKSSHSPQLKIKQQQITVTSRSAFCVKFLQSYFTEMLSTVLAVILLTFLKDVDAEKKATACPRGCNCVGDLTTPGSHLTIDCKQGLPHIDEKQLTRQLNSLLSSDRFIERLTSLTIANTLLKRVPTSTCKLLHLNSLYLDHNRLTKLPDNCFTKLTKLVTFSARGNPIGGLQDGLFDGLQNLVTLDLSHNKISFIGLRVFSNSSDLTSLRSVVLDSNKLTSLEPWWYYRCILGSKTSPVRINLVGNLISNFTNELQLKFRCGMKQPFGNVDLGYNRILHLMDFYEGWNIISGGESLLSTWICLVNPDGPHARFSISAAGEYYLCDCKDYLFYKLASSYPMAKILYGVACDRNKFISPGGQRVYAATIPLIQFTCQLSDRCPSKCQCVYRPDNITLHIYCSATKLSSLPLDLTPPPKSYVKYKLDFSNSKLLRRLEHRPYFVNTSILDVSNCALTEITVEDLKDVSSISLVNFRGNMLRTFPKQAEVVNISASFLIGGNPWRCSCDNSWMIGWLQSLSHQISDPGDITCASPPRMYGRNVLKSTVEDFCVDPVKRVVTITLSAASSVAFVVFLLLIAGIVIYKLRVKFFKRWKFHPFDRDECLGEDMDYDVFLCSSSQDEDPHVLRILGEMESNGYRVYYHERDFLPGQLIMDNVGQGIERSKRVVCLISDNFLRR